MKFCLNRKLYLIILLSIMSFISLSGTVKALTPQPNQQLNTLRIRPQTSHAIVGAERARKDPSRSDRIPGFPLDTIVIGLFVILIVFNVRKNPRLRTGNPFF